MRAYTHASEDDTYNYSKYGRIKKKKVRKKRKRGEVRPCSNINASHHVSRGRQGFIERKP